MLVALVALVSFAVLVVLPPVFLALALRVFSEDCRTPKMRPAAAVTHALPRHLGRLTS
jgi:hypothetical protein